MWLMTTINQKTQKPLQQRKKASANPRHGSQAAYQCNQELEQQLNQRDERHPNDQHNKRDNDESNNNHLPTRDRQERED